MSTTLASRVRCSVLTPLAACLLPAFLLAAPAGAELFASQLDAKNVREHITGGPDAVGGIGDWAIGN